MNEQEPNDVNNKENPKNKWLAIIFCVFFGYFGAHKFYENKIGMGILYLCTFGLCGIGVIIDLIALLQKSDTYYVESTKVNKIPEFISTKANKTSTPNKVRTENQLSLSSSHKVCAVCGKRIKFGTKIDDGILCSICTLKISSTGTSPYINMNASKAKTLLNDISDTKHNLNFEFPETDASGHKILTIYDMNVVGVMHIQDGIDPQTIIPKLYEKEQIILETDSANRYDPYAVKVKTINGVQIGWLPKGENLQIDISKRLNSGQTVLARIKKAYLLNNYPGKVGIVIDVARYSKR